MPSAEHFDVIIVGAGLSGIGAASHLRRKCPDKSFAILEARDAMGGTWDLFRYPGIRSDSDMYTLGYDFKPWVDDKAIADGPAILSYVHETARENGLDSKIRYGHKATRIAWSTDDAQWTIDIDRKGGSPVRMTCNFLLMCTGYYDYAQGYTPEFPGRDRFRGRVVHPQFWSEDIDYAGKRVIVIGSGATAVTIVPEMSKTAARVYMLQRSPTYIVSRPSQDAIANWLRERLPDGVAYGLTRWKNVLLGMFFYELSRRRPEKVKKYLLDLLRKELPPDYDVEQHFTPYYNPWDQRLCLVPDADLFASIREGKVEMVTDHIDTFTERGILLKSGRELEADLIVTATGLKLQFLSGMELVVDGKHIEPSQTMNYKGSMFSDVPNLVCLFGYTNASWTLKADLSADYACRLIDRMTRTGAKQCTPRLKDPRIVEEPFLTFTSGYIQRALSQFPKQGSRRPWKLYQNYVFDILMMRHGELDDGTMEFTSPPPREVKTQPMPVRPRPMPS